MRYFIRFSYYGAAYHGWQRQPNAVTVQEVLEDCLSALLGEKITVVGAGRTDAGVHAKTMFAHMDTELEFEPARLVDRLNAFLPADIAVQGITMVPADAHARFDALERTYAYWVVPIKDPFLWATAHYVKQPLNMEAMDRAAQLLLGKQDFASFSKSGTDVKTYICEVKLAQWAVVAGKYVFTITADRFLRNMVRAIVGTLLEVGRGTYGPDHVKVVLKSRDRAMAGPSVPAKGLYLTSVKYPDTFFNNG